MTREPVKMIFIKTDQARRSDHIRINVGSQTKITAQSMHFVKMFEGVGQWFQNNVHIAQNKARKGGGGISERRCSEHVRQILLIRLCHNVILCQEKFHRRARMNFSAS